MKIQFFSPGPLHWDYEMTPCSAVPRTEDAIVLPVGKQRPDGGFDTQTFVVSLIEWWPSEGVVKVFLLPEAAQPSQGYDDDTAVLVKVAGEVQDWLRQSDLVADTALADKLYGALRPFTPNLEP